MSRIDDTVEGLVEMTARAVSGVFAAYGVPLQQPRPTSRTPQSIPVLAKEAGIDLPAFAATIAFSGPMIQGELLLAATFDVVARTRPSVGRNPMTTQSTVSQLMGRDWIGELANQVLGRLKTMHRGPAFAFETRQPLPLLGQAVVSMTPKSAATRPVMFRAGNGGVWFWLDVVCDPDFQLGAQGAPPADDGGLVLLQPAEDERDG